ncbi:lmo0937 family membrane protein [Sediminibacterium sp.]|uniref:lmo0937 family membrane protein n=1 Tax=Sediminibacterium sp. TaxID=1917865 RepID=UPI0025DC5B5C|nr:lmo0937 family membrane protein [Sediminibacterium sp.]MBW0176847.1 lmo0937 family membrane protein [Sediminibacterium sp.]
MSNLLYIIAIILLIIWATGYFAYNAGQVIHILLFIAVVAILLRFIKGGKIF